MRLNRRVVTFLVVPAILSAPAVAADTCELRIRFTDRVTEEPVPGLVAVIEDAQRNESLRVVTDLAGVATFPRVPTGTALTLRVSYPGANSISQEVSCKGSSKDLSIKLDFIQTVSLVTLIANPKQYSGQYVRVTGVLRLEFEGEGLYLTRADAAHRVSANAIWVESTQSMHDSKRRLQQRYVRVVGRFSAENRGHMNAFAGALEDIREVRRYDN